MMYDALKLSNQLCFPLYACSREIVRLYKPYLDEIGLTYTQYIVMLVLWEKNEASVKELGERLHLDSGTLTPLLKKLELLGLVVRSRDKADERSVIISLTHKGEGLKDHAADIPGKVAQCVPLDADEAAQLYELLYRVLLRLEHRDGCTAE